MWHVSASNCGDCRVTSCKFKDANMSGPMEEAKYGIVNSSIHAILVSNSERGNINIQ